MLIISLCKKDRLIYHGQSKFWNYIITDEKQLSHEDGTHMHELLATERIAPSCRCVIYDEIISKNSCFIF